MVIASIDSSALAGIVLAARNASATPKAGDGFEMDAIASCYIGGAAVAGGAVTIDVVSKRKKG